MKPLLPWEEARRRVVDGVVPLPPSRVPVREALGRSLAEAIVAPESMPPFDNAAMDGFAIRAQDVRGASRESPVSLEVVAEIPAGRGDPPPVGAGQAARIMTGAPVPAGANAVVMVEATSVWDATAECARPPVTGEAVRVFGAVAPGTNIRRRGESITRGEVILGTGVIIRSQELGVLLSVGVMEVNVYLPPRVAVLSTGDELVPAETAPGAGEVRDSNRPALLGLLAEHGFPALDLGHVGDETGAIEDRIRQGVTQGDFLLTIGGVSVGDYDLTRRVLGRLGRVEAYSVAVKPGKPQVFGHIGGVPVFGLPGNPVSSLVVFDTFVLPALKKMAGRRELFWPTFLARLEEPLTRRGGRTEFVRVHLTVSDGEWVARSTGPQGSGVLSSMMRANGYAILPPEARALAAGERVPCQLWRRNE